MDEKNRERRFDDGVIPDLLEVILDGTGWEITHSGDDRMTIERVDSVPTDNRFQVTVDSVGESPLIAMTLRGGTIYLGPGMATNLAAWIYHRLTQIDPNAGWTVGNLVDTIKK